MDQLTPASELSVYGELHLMRYLFGIGDWALADDAWRAAVVPPFSFIMRRATVFFSLVVTDSAVLAAPVRQDGGFWSLDEEMGCISWRFVFDLEAVFVISVELCSPLRCFLLGTAPENLMVRARMTGAPVPILKYQAPRGLALVSESCMLRLIRDRSIPEPSIENGYLPEELKNIEVAYAIALSRSLDPSLTEDDLCKAMEARCKAAGEMMDEYVGVEASDDLLGDLALRQDACLIRKQKADVAKTVAVTTKKVQVAMTAVHGSYKRVPAAKPRGPRQKPSAKAKAAAKAERLWNDIVADRSVIDRFSPSSLSLFVDVYNGCFRVSQPGIPGATRKSVSWTLRCDLPAKQEVLRIAWERHSAFFGEDSPVPAKMWVP